MHRGTSDVVVFNRSSYISSVSADNALWVRNEPAHGKSAFIVLATIAFHTCLSKVWKHMKEFLRPI